MPKVRWAVLEEGKRGLRSWEESAYIFLSENYETAFQQALAKGRRTNSIVSQDVEWLQPNWRR